MRRCRATEHENSQALWMLLPLLGERAGVRASVSFDLILGVGGGKETRVRLTEESLGYATFRVFDRVFPPHPDPLPQEREQQASDWCLADGLWANPGAGVIERRRTILPLPRGAPGERAG